VAVAVARSGLNNRNRIFEKLRFSLETPEFFEKTKEL